MKTELRYAGHPEDVKGYDTEKLRKEFLIENIFVPDNITLVYSLYDRYVVGGAMPVNKSLKLDTMDDLKASYFLKRREMGIINVGGEAEVEAGAPGRVLVDYNQNAWGRTLATVYSVRPAACAPPSPTPLAVGRGRARRARSRTFAIDNVPRPHRRASATCGSRCSPRAAASGWTGWAEPESFTR